MENNDVSFDKIEQAKDIEKGISLMLNPLRRDTSRIFVLSSSVDKNNVISIKLCGGLNGNGDWANYFADLCDVVKALKVKYELWLIEMHNDCADDVFYATFGVNVL